MIEDDPKNPRRVLTVRGAGCVFAKSRTPTANDMEPLVPLAALNAGESAIPEGTKQPGTLEPHDASGWAGRAARRSAPNTPIFVRCGRLRTVGL